MRIDNFHHIIWYKQLNVGISSLTSDKSLPPESDLHSPALMFLVMGFRPLQRALSQIFVG